MQWIRVCAGIAALACASGAWAADQKAEPPAEWAAYIAAMREYDAIPDAEQRCRLLPDLPGNQWVPGAAKGRCAILRKPIFTLDEIDTLLETQGGRAELERRFEALLQANYDDPDQHDQISVAFQPFEKGGRAFQVAERWRKASPDSAFAHVASATFLETTGWTARGQRYIGETSRDRLRKMDWAFEAAVPLYLQALEIEPRLTPACIGLAKIGRQSDNVLQKHALRACREADPNAYFVALENITAAEPRWGGSDKALAEAVADAAQRAQDNPMLGALLGEAAGYRPSLASDLGPVADQLAEAARMGPSAGLSARAGRGYLRRRDPWSAVVYLSQGLRFRPDDAYRRYERAWQLRTLGDLAWAYTDMRVALDIEPHNGSYHYLMGLVERETHGEATARPYFKRAMQSPDERVLATGMYCQGYVTDAMWDDADACTRDFVADFPDEPEAWRLRGWYLDKVDDPGATDAFEHYVRIADTCHPFHKQQVEAVKRLLQRRAGADE
ncbi:DUF4034 domain-containing protein [Marilutibacter maris]|uniref:DUF4034 domain-containing protein n=1 Tax=Marilutibacter maris TaxID=1605891 RepID=UPI000DA955E6|nr:DUF4034 domain-containing protein [Lysobacter maris]